MNKFIQAGLLFSVAFGVIFLVYFFNSSSTIMGEQGLDETILPENVTRVLIESGKAIGDLPSLIP